MESVFTWSVQFKRCIDFLHQNFPSKASFCIKAPVSRHFREAVQLLSLIHIDDTKIVTSNK